MRVQATGTAGYANASAAARRRSDATFSLGDAGTARAADGPAAPRAVGGIDTLLALQAVDEAGERRRRAVKRGRSALDALDALKLGLIAGSLDAGALSRLRSSATGLVEASGDPALDGVMAEIGLRAEVELAKLDAAAKR